MFHQTVVSAVDKYLDEDTEKVHIIGRRLSWRKAVILASAVALAIGTTVFAAVNSELLSKLRIILAPQKTEELIQNDVSTVSKESTPLTIEETLYDGGYLYIYATPTDELKNYSVNTDRLYINDKEVGPVTTVYYEEQRDYTFSVDLTSENLTSDFTVRLPLNLYSDAPQTVLDNETYNHSEKADTIELVFDVPCTNKMQSMKDDICIPIENGTVTVKKFEVMPTQTVIAFDYVFVGDNAEQRAEEMTNGTNFYFEDDLGNVYDWVSGQSGVSYNENGKAGTHNTEFTLPALKENVSSLKIVPYSVMDESGYNRENVRTESICEVPVNN